jgi:hypothetical protein
VLDRRVGHGGVHARHQRTNRSSRKQVLWHAVERSY